MPVRVSSLLWVLDDIIPLSTEVKHLMLDGMSRWQFGQYLVVTNVCCFYGRDLSKVTSSNRMSLVCSIRCTWDEKRFIFSLFYDTFFFCFVFLFFLI